MTFNKGTENFDVKYEKFDTRDIDIPEGKNEQEITRKIYFKKY